MPSLKLLGLIMIIACAPLAGCSSANIDPAPWPPRGEWHAYGQPLTNAPREVALGELDGGERKRAVRAHIDEVCLNKGCWLRISDPNDPSVPAMLVKPRDYDFFLPRNSGGRDVIVYGEAVRKTLSVGDLRHFAADAHKSEAEIAQITQPQEQIVFYADSVLIEGPGLEPPIQ